MKRLTAFAVALILIFTLFPAAAAAEFSAEDLTSKSVALIDANTGSVIFEKDGDRERYPASTTKIMTAIVVLENTKLDDVVTAGSEINKFDDQSSMMGLKEGEKLTIEQLLYGLLLPSGNDAAAALAVHVGGSIAGFADMMNAKAKELGLTHTHFINPHGLTNDAHYTTAKELAQIAAYAYKNETFRKIVSTRTYTIQSSNKRSNPLVLTNTNRLLDPESDSYYAGTTGIKTGSTSAAGGCLVASAEKNGRTLIAVILLDETTDKTARWSDGITLLDYGFENAADINVTDLNVQNSISIAVDGAAEDDPSGGIVQFSAQLDGVAISGTNDYINELKTNAASITMSVQFDKQLAAPVTQGDVLGTAIYYYNGAKLFSVQLTAQNSVYESGAVETPAPNTSSSPTAAQNEPVEPADNSTLLFWILVALVVIIIVVVIRIIIIKRGRHGRKYYNYK